MHVHASAQPYGPGEQVSDGGNSMACGHEGGRARASLRRAGPLGCELLVVPRALAYMDGGGR
jgi:hypothetical protein